MEQSNHIWDQFTSGNASYKVKRIKEIEEIEEKIKKEELDVGVQFISISEILKQSRF